ncbi:hypothetical protein [Croceicoccus mobilis]|uniref:Uncharacterized protein n=1 Tax=Croceicoccus mobilis TaxID=1703339 RepID=A0A916Z3M0_9SPHN|nr:hypothetical protein [Croceicoccus mobilis]GGD74126.1 hypothetical protein GCM10010990_24710 [Croceicoccus mobilis]
MKIAPRTAATIEKLMHSLGADTDLSVQPYPHPDDLKRQLWTVSANRGRTMYMGQGYSLSAALEDFDAVVRRAA